MNIPQSSKLNKINFINYNEFIYCNGDSFMTQRFEKHKDKRIKEIHKRVLNFNKKKKN